MIRLESRSNDFLLRARARARREEDAGGESRLPVYTREDIETRKIREGEILFTMSLTMSLPEKTVKF